MTPLDIHKYAVEVVSSQFYRVFQTDAMYFSSKRRLRAFDSQEHRVPFTTQSGLHFAELPTPMGVDHTQTPNACPL